MASKKQTELKNKWKNKGYFVINLISIYPRGLPDLIAVKPNHIVFIESKEKTDRLSGKQKVWFHRLIKWGFDVYLNDNKYVSDNETAEF